MPVKQKYQDEIYTRVDESGKTVYSNIKVEKEVKPPPAKSPPMSAEPPFPKKQAKVAKEMGVKPAAKHFFPGKDGTKSTGNILTPFIVFLLVAMVVQLFLKELMRGKRRKYRPGDLGREKPRAERMEEEFAFDFGEPGVASPSPLAEWSREFINSLEWREFEKLCARLLEEKGFQVKLNMLGPDEGVDIVVYRPGELERPYAIAQCKAYRKEVKVDTVRALKGVMAAQGVAKGFFFAAGGFYKKAMEFGSAQNIELFTADRMLEAIKSLPQEKQDAMLQDIVTTDYTTPTCVQCGVKMIWRSSFWGCVNYPRCSNTLNRRWSKQKQGGFSFRV